MPQKIVRSICYFTTNPTLQHIDELDKLGSKLESIGYQIQTKRVCTQGIDTKELYSIFKDVIEERSDLEFGIGTVDHINLKNRLLDFCDTKHISLNIDLTRQEISENDVNLLFDIINTNPQKTFNFAYVFNNQPSSPFFPSGTFEKEGFSIGLQSTNLAQGCNELDQWLDNIKSALLEISQLFSNDDKFLGIDSSIAPLFEKESSLINFIRKITNNFSSSVTTDTFTRITKFIKENNPKPIGLNGLMFPCLEDFELADEYEKGNFTIERNIFLSLHSGLGIDTYPIGIDESPKKVLQILKLIQALSNKYKKPLSVRFVSDGKAKIGQKSNYDNQYLKDVVVREL
jgi:uncharacterized protein (UPF0210 family)